MQPQHPLDMLTGEEIERAVALVRSTGRLSERTLFAHVVLDEPDKAELAQWKEGDPVERAVRVLAVPGPTLDLVEAVVSLTGPHPGNDEVREWRAVEGMRPALLMTEAMNAMFTTKEHPEYIAALARRGITDLDSVQIDPWPAGAFGYDAEQNRRIARCISFVRADATDNGYARPIEGVMVHFDLGANEVIEVIDLGEVPLPPNRASYYAEDQPSLRAELKPISITQPDGPSFTVEGNLVAWAQWRFRVAFDPYEGLVLHQVAYDDDGRDETDPFGAAPRVDQRDGGALRRSGCRTGLEERVRRGGVGARPDDAATPARMRLHR